MLRVHLRHRLRRRRPGAVVLLAVLLLLPLGACAAGTADADRPTLTYWATYQTAKPEQTETVMREQLAEFTERTGIAVELDLVSWSTLYSRILTAVSSGSGPDLVNIGTTWAAPLQETGAFVPFDEQTLEAIGGADRFLSAAWEATGAPGQAPMSVPLLRQSYGLFYNTAMFDEAGIKEPPATWDEFVEVARKLTTPDRWGLALLGSAASTNAHLAFILARQAGTNLVDETGAPNLTDPAVATALAQYMDLMTEHAVVNPSCAEWSGEQADAAFVDGRAAMIIGQNGVRAYLKDAGFADYAVAPLPGPNLADSGGGASVRSIVGGTNVAVFEGSEHRDEALALVRFLTEADTQTALNTTFNALPVTTAALQNKAFADPVTTVFARILAEHSEPMPQTPEWGTTEALLGAAISGLWGRAAVGTLTDADVGLALAAVDQQVRAGD